ncbi:hypothetical protein KGA66_02940 [Actinocrinis puniceicyclus]|uniref:Uncharacterized protein n=1 Tax=Actinocrinis puniceicyclus TaxID=977794 RepID=A0A8J8BAE4_9ACTN|nr:hypothetical protein [Actinocrinis puniceicyclus]MBS2961988.1 hypothetical protein [Actinocrinis puniceicyclus]
MRDLERPGEVEGDLIVGLPPAAGPPPDRTQAILDAAKQVGSLLKAAGHRFALAGGVAAYAHGVPMSTRVLVPSTA